MRRLMLALAVTTAFAAPPAFAQTAGDTADVRCLLALQAMAADPKARDQAVRGVYYYLGKLSNRGGLGRLQGTVLSEGKAMNSAPKVQAELTRCGAELNRSTQDLQTSNQRAAAAFKASMGAPAAGAAPAAEPAKK